MWRPGKLRFLIGVKNPLPIRPAVTARKHGPLQGRAVARFATSVGLRPPFVTHPATLPHPDRRSLLILFAAQQSPHGAVQTRTPSCSDPTPALSGSVQ